MSTHRTLSWAIPGTAEEILQRCADPDVARRRAECDSTLQAGVTHLSTQTRDGATLDFEVAGHIPDSWIPSVVTAKLAKHSGGSGRPGITRRETWYLQDDGGAHATVTIDLTGIPATRVGAAARLTPDGTNGPDACTLTYDLELDIALPLLGSTIERAVLHQIAGALDKEAVVIQSCGV